jgi:hypothetical protein
VSAVTPMLVVGRTRGRTRAVAMAPAPVMTAGRSRGRARSVMLSVTPVLLVAGSTFSNWVRGALLTVTPSLVVSRKRARSRATAMSAAPVMLATGAVGGGGDVTQETLSVTCECYLNVPGSIEATMECEVGVPYQADIRIQPTDRWQQMYPSG